MSLVFVVVVKRQGIFASVNGRHLALVGWWRLMWGRS